MRSLIIHQLCRQGPDSIRRARSGSRCSSFRFSRARHSGSARICSIRDSIASRSSSEKAEKSGLIEASQWSCASGDSSPSSRRSANLSRRSAVVSCSSATPSASRVIIWAWPMIGLRPPSPPIPRIGSSIIFRPLPPLVSPEVPGYLSSLVSPTVGRETGRGQESSNPTSPGVGSDRDAVGAVNSVGAEIEAVDRLDYVELGFKRNWRDRATWRSAGICGACCPFLAPKVTADHRHRKQSDGG